MLLRAFETYGETLPDHWVQILSTGLRESTSGQTWM